MSTGESYPRLARQPLTLVLAEFRFGPAADLFGGAAGIREHADLRDMDFEERLTLEIQAGPDGCLVHKPGRLWVFLNQEQGCLVQLERDRLIVATTRYPRFDAFAAQCLEHVRTLEKYLKPENLLRVGLRYNDSVVPWEGEGLGHYLHERLLPVPLLEAEGALAESHRIETLVRTDAGLLALRALVGRHGMSVMPDLAGMIPLNPPANVPADRITAVLDFDHFWKPTTDIQAFTAQEADRRLRLLHHAARAAFWEITTDFARRHRWA